MVGRGDDLLVVLDHDDGVTQTGELLQDLGQAAAVARVQAAGRLVEHVADSHQPAADLGAKADALTLAAGEACAAAIEGEIVHAYIC